MKVPGRAWLEFELKSASQTSTDLYISAIFDPNGWYYMNFVWILRGFIDILF